MDTKDETEIVKLKELIKTHLGPVWLSVFNGILNEKKILDQSVHADEIGDKLIQEAIGSPKIKPLSKRISKIERNK